MHYSGSPLCNSKEVEKKIDKGFGIYYQIFKVENNKQ